MIRIGIYNNQTLTLTKGLKTKTKINYFVEGKKIKIKFNENRKKITFKRRKKKFN